MELTPKEKAEELYNNYYKLYWEYDNLITKIPFLKEMAKKYVLIAVDEIIKTYLEIDPKLTYWREVKEELLKM